MLGFPLPTVIDKGLEANDIHIPHWLFEITAPNPTSLSSND